MPAYVIFIREKTIDEVEIHMYETKVPAALAGHPLKLLALFGSYEVMDGPEVEGVSMLEFPSFQEAKAWYHSRAHQEIVKHRLNGAVYRVIIFEGVPFDGKPAEENPWFARHAGDSLVKDRA
jgi:uncharacterized protein (DUF1330 family)